MRLLLLAAGKSSRIYNKIKKNKCLININHKSLIRNIVDSAYKNKIEKIDIITGFKPNNIKKDLRNYKKFVLSIIQNIVAPIWFIQLY